MEEFAKVAGDSIKFQKTLKFLTVFMNELGYSNEDRLLGEIQERIFHHLIRQSEVEPHHPENMVFGLMLKVINAFIVTFLIASLSSCNQSIIVLS